MLPFTGVGGTELAQLRLLQAAEGHGVASVAFCTDAAPTVSAFFRSAGVETATWYKRDAPSRFGASFTVRTAMLAAALLRRRIDIVHCADTTAVTPQVVLACRIARARLVCHVRNRNNELIGPQRAALRRVDHFVFVSRATWQAYGLDVAPEHGTVLYDGVMVDDPAGADDARIAARASARAAIVRELGLPDGAPLVGMVARVEPQKDFATLARATARLVREFPDLRVLVLGGTDVTAEQRLHFPQVQQVIADCGVTDHIVFVGFRSDVAQILRALDVSVLATHWEGLPLVLWEAMAQGTPVVATGVDGVPEAIEDGVTGLLVRHDDDAHLAERVAGLLRDPAGARALGDRGRAFARASFSTERFAEQTLRVYREATGPR